MYRYGGTDAIHPHEGRSGKDNYYHISLLISLTAPGSSNCVHGVSQDGTQPSRRVVSGSSRCVAKVGD